MGAVIGIIVVIGLVWLIYAGRVKVLASRRYNWNRRESPDLGQFSRGAGASKTKGGAEQLDEPPSERIS
jgi:hypothetical protein